MYELIQRIIYRWFHFDKRIVSLRSRSLLINSRQSTVIFIFFFFVVEVNIVQFDG